MGLGKSSQATLFKGRGLPQVEGFPNLVRTSSEVSHGKHASWLEITYPFLNFNGCAVFGLFNCVPSVPRVTMILCWKGRIVMCDSALSLTRSKQMSLTCRMYSCITCVNKLSIYQSIYMLFQMVNNHPLLSSKLRLVLYIVLYCHPLCQIILVAAKLYPSRHTTQW